LPPKADMFSIEINVCFVPIADIGVGRFTLLFVIREPWMVFNVSDVTCRHRKCDWTGPKKPRLFLSSGLSRKLSR
jgi:hypothetical protein